MMQPDSSDGDRHFMRIAIDVSRRSREHGRHPFGAIIVAADGTVLGEAENRAIGPDADATGHAETEVVRNVSARYSPAQLRSATLYSSGEPCAMCAGALYWAGIGRLVYGYEESDLLRLTGNHPENPTLALPCRQVFASGQRPVEVVGPLLADEALTVHDGFWQRS